jgi:hypothetical protein
MERPFFDWSRHPLLAWAILLVALAGAFAVYMCLLKRSWHFRDDYALLAVYWGATLHTLYRRGCQRDQRTRLKPSPFFFWFSR